ncbi:MAG: hypothetical protein GY714_18135 [Desulfobacterales bacterium]|nr:hypothetical protein [Desulfobacterales bacterium]
MGFWSVITGAKAIDTTTKIAEKTTDGIISGLDKIFYTKEEQAETLTRRLEIADKIATTHIKLMEATASETTTRSITRRIVAIFVMILTFISMFSMGLVWKLDKEWALFMLELVKHFQIGVAFISVIFFFFGNYLIGKFTKK